MAIGLKQNKLQGDEITKQELLKLLMRFLMRLIIVLVYNVVGAFIFMYMEGEQSIWIKTMYKFKNNTDIQEFLNITKQKLVSNVTATGLIGIANEMLNFTKNSSQIIIEETVEPYAERFSTWLYFCFVSVMTIGYGDVTPKTNDGKIFLIGFSMIGIPIMLWLLFLCGQLQTTCHCKLVSVICRAIAKIRKTRDNSKPYTKILAVGVAFSYVVMFGALAIYMIKKNSNWSYIDSSYYWYCTMTTIGFGDLSLRPHAVQNVASWLVFKVFGLAMMAGLLNAIFCWLQETRFKKATSREISKALGKIKSYELNGQDSCHANIETAVEANKNSEVQVIGRKSAGD